MKNSIKLLSAFLLITNFTFGQGCSDAGLCNLQNTKDVDDFLTKHHAITTGIGYGLGVEKVNISSSYLEYAYSIDENLSFQSKLTYQNTTGDFGNVSGLGDIYLTANYRLSTINDYDFRFLISGKLPLSTANSKNNSNLSLPMSYQTSLGTYDLIIGSSMTYNKKWDYTLAFQIPVSNKNENQFMPILFNNTDKYEQTTGFIRKPDALLKVGYFFNLEDSRFTFNPNLLGVFHLGKDQFTDLLNNKVEINGSEGYTVNLILNTILTFRDDSQLTLALAPPSPYRNTNRPDGSLRVFGINLQYKIKF